MPDHIIGHVWNRNGEGFPKPRPWGYLHRICQSDLKPGETFPKTWLEDLRKMYSGIEFEFRPTESSDAPAAPKKKAAPKSEE